MEAREFPPRPTTPPALPPSWPRRWTRRSCRSHRRGAGHPREIPEDNPAGAQNTLASCAVSAVRTAARPWPGRPRTSASRTSSGPLTGRSPTCAATARRTWSTAGRGAADDVCIAVRAALREILETTSLANLRDGQLPQRVRDLANDPEAWVSLGPIRGAAGASSAPSTPGGAAAASATGRGRAQPQGLQQRQVVDHDLTRAGEREAHRLDSSGAASPAPPGQGRSPSRACGRWPMAATPPPRAQTARR